MDILPVSHNIEFWSLFLDILFLYIDFFVHSGTNAIHV